MQKLPRNKKLLGFGIRGGKYALLLESINAEKKYDHRLGILGMYKKPPKPTKQKDKYSRDTNTFIKHDY